MAESQTGPGKPWCIDIIVPNSVGKDGAAIQAAYFADVAGVTLKPRGFSTALDRSTEDRLFRSGRIGVGEDVVTIGATFDSQEAKDAVLAHDRVVRVYPDFAIGPLSL